MDKGKGVRKYGRVRQGLRWGRYFAHKSVVFPIAIVAVIAFVVGIFGTVVALLLSLFFLMEGNRYIDDRSSVMSCLIVLLVSGGIAVVSGLFSYRFGKAPVGNVLNPAPPTENPLLPDTDLLVRASSSSAAQPAELLRSATETAEQKSEELLRLVEQHR